MAEINEINNSETGLSVREKLNFLIDFVNDFEVKDASFNKFIRNLKDYEEEKQYNAADQLIQVKYITPTGSIIKTINWLGSQVKSVVLSGDVPAGIPTTQTRLYNSKGLNKKNIYS